MRLFVRVVLGLVLLFTVVFVLILIRAKSEGAPRLEAHYQTASAVDDGFGVPTITGSSWEDVVEAEGFVIASDRMFQLDLMRRAATGRLSALVGAKALPLDKRRMEEDWPGVVERAYRDLPADERRLVDAYAHGVNRFIQSRAGHHGLEYAVLRSDPEPWQGSDSLAILLMMCEDLSSSAPAEANEGRFRRALPAEWADFLFTVNHPWNEPMFGGPNAPIVFPSTPLPPGPLEADEGVIVGALEEPSERRSALAEALAPMGFPPVAGPLLASNNWAYCGSRGCFVANDPHLGYNVPELWFAVLLKQDEQHWVAGLALPGLPGVALGMNPHLAWAFTNTGEDVDDLLAETLSPDGKRYLARKEGDREVWEDVIVKTSTIMVKNGAPVKVVSRFTHRGPVSAREGLLGELSRQWLPLKPGMLRLPAGLVSAKNAEELNAALDGMRAPAQNVVYADVEGNVGYRTSGTTIHRRISGRVPAFALDGEWLGIYPESTRPRRVITKSSTEALPHYIATANQRIWVDGGGHVWGDDGRHERIRRGLSGHPDLGTEDMEKLQLDTESRFHRELVRWTIEGAHPKTAAESAMVERLAKWNGVAADDPRSFTEALLMERSFSMILVGRVRKKILGQEAQGASYTHRLARAWMLAVLASPSSTQVFGVDPAELKARLIQVAAAIPPGQLYTEENRWAAQHPFADTVPVLGSWFKISTPPQFGYRNLVRTEAPKFGASVRVVWKVGDLAGSRISLPIGQSGHIASPHFEDARADWFAGEYRPFVGGSAQ
ncbi:MAG: penicillin acylase family protein [Myxococcota bacterium]